jgi:hypothetical protein
MRVLLKENVMLNDEAKDHYNRVLTGKRLRLMVPTALDVLG